MTDQKPEESGLETVGAFKKECPLGAVEVTLLARPKNLGPFEDGEELVRWQVAELRALADAFENTLRDNSQKG